MRYFRKELPENPVYIMGQPFRFDFFATEDAVLIAELDKCVHRQMGGVVSITEAEYAEEVKKKEQSAKYASSSNGNQFGRRQEIVAPQFQHLNLGLDQSGRRVAAVVANPSSRRGGLLAQQALPQRDEIRAPNAVSRPEMPDPIQIPTPAQFAKPPTAKVGDLK